MNDLNPKVDQYLIDGCGRCPLYKTAQCKVHTWQEELKLLRSIVLECGLHEDYKWSQPCYTFKNKNLIIVTAFKDHAALAFFNGSLLEDANKILVKPGESSQAAKQLRFTNTAEIIKQKAIIKAYIFEAIETQKAGIKVKFKESPEPIPEELQQKMNENPLFKDAFKALTPGRQRGYILHFSQPKQSKTRESRIDKCLQQILNGEGLNDNYKSKKK